LLSRIGAEIITRVTDRLVVKLHTLIHRQYNEAYNALYPFIKLDGSKYLIKNIASFDTTNIYSVNQVKKFIDPNNQNLALLYNNLCVKEITSGILKGQVGVFTKTCIKANTCIGVHGGIVFDLKKSKMENTMFKINQDYLVELNLTDDEIILLDGLNIVSKINSNFRHVANDDWVESKGGYNVQAIEFHCEMGDGKTIKLHAIFTKRRIPKNTELRLNYGYEDHIVKQAITTARICKDISEIDIIKKLQSQLILKK